MHNFAYIRVLLKYMLPKYRKLVALMALSLLLGACNSSKRCGCPTFGKYEIGQEKMRVQEYVVSTPAF
jgi:hypothetical protein